MRLKGKIAAITGAGRGIGRAAAELFGFEGASVAILEIDRASGVDAQHAIERSGGRAHFVYTDVTDPRSVREAFEEIHRAFGGLHVLYNNASIFAGDSDKPIAELSTEAWRRILAVNLDSVFFCCKQAIPMIIESGGGSVINTGSSASLIGIPGCDAYTASKGATVALTRSMAVEYGPKKVRVNCIAPAAVDTPMLRESSIGRAHFDEQAFFRTTPVGRYGTPQEIARVALFLASDESSYVNGAVIVADGGITIT